MTKFHFLQFQIWLKINFWTGKTAKTVISHTKKYLFDFMSFFAWTFLNFLACCVTTTTTIICLFCHREKLDFKPGNWMLFCVMKSVINDFLTKVPNEVQILIRQNSICQEIDERAKFPSSVSRLRQNYYFFMKVI